MSDIQALIAAALYDFAGRITTANPSFEVGSVKDVTPIIDHLDAFLRERGVELKNDPPIREWQDLMRIEVFARDAAAHQKPPCCFSEDLANCVNRWNKDTTYGMPDFVLAEMIVQLLESVGRANVRTDEWMAFHEFQLATQSIAESPGALEALEVSESPEATEQFVFPFGTLVIPRGSLGEEVTPAQEPYPLSAIWPFPTSEKH